MMWLRLVILLPRPIILVLVVVVVAAVVVAVVGRRSPGLEVRVAHVMGLSRQMSWMTS